MVGLNTATVLSSLREVATAGVVVSTADVVRARVVELVTATRVVVGVVKMAVTTSSSLSLSLSFFVSWVAAVVATTTAVFAGRVACWAKKRMSEMEKEVG